MAIDQQGPAVFIFIDLDVFMRDLPEQLAKILLRPWRVDMLRDVSAADGAGAKRAFVFSCYFYVIDCLSHGLTGIQFD